KPVLPAIASACVVGRSRHARTCRGAGHSDTAALGHAAALISMDTLSANGDQSFGRKMRRCCHEEFDAGKLYMICLELQQNSQQNLRASLLVQQLRDKKVTASTGNRAESALTPTRWYPAASRSRRKPHGWRP